MDNAISIDDVISKLDEVIRMAKLQNNRIGYFAALYRRMTIAVKAGILNKVFEDPARMERLDVIFANRYLQALGAYTNGRPCSAAWQAVFDSCKNTNLIVLQHLIMGINVHINLDLCIAAVETCPGNTIGALKNDFDKINQIIAFQAEAVQECLSKIWFPLRLLSKITQRPEDAVLNFSIETARACSWANALLLSSQTKEAQQHQISSIDLMVKNLGIKIINPKIMLNFVLKTVNVMEDKIVGKNIDLLLN